MTEISDVVLAEPSIPTKELEEAFRALQKSSRLRDVSTSILRDIQEALGKQYVLAVWVLKGPAFRRKIYSVEERASALATHDEHKRNYAAVNPALMKIYEPEELIAGVVP